MKKYNHLEIEKNKYKHWKKKEYFKSGDLSKEPFCIVIPPPNVTGRLHLGHAWNTTLQDIIIRYKRMTKFDVLWLPGMDHAGIATQAKVDEKLREEGLNPRAMKREEWLKHAFEWKEKYAVNIREQWAKLGLSLDYTKERFTLDEGLNHAVNHVFISLYKKGLIYRGERIINWDPVQMTALSNEEVIHKETKGTFYYLKYYLKGTTDYLEVATTRPETIFGDVAVAVNPQDERYKHLIGKEVRLPIVNKTIPVIADSYVDANFGTGVVKITPAHDANDFEIGKRHHLKSIIVINTDGTMNEKAKPYQGLDRFVCRKKLEKDLQKENLLIKTEEITHAIGYSERSNAIIEPYLSKQWFVKMRSLADKVLDNQKKSSSKINFIPPRFEKILNHWMEITYDWCISRQLWWGHRIPAWYNGKETYVGYEPPKEKGWIQDTDVLDTWFSSALWPFSTLGWPEKTNLLERYYPNNVLVTGYDIIPFWVCRMAFQSLEFMGDRPFKDCLIHGLIRDKEGRKMSKSLGNGVDPNDVIKQYGSDTLRFFLTTNSAPGQDLRYDEEKVKATWNFINKLWNASRFVLINIKNYQPSDLNLKEISNSDKWILDKQTNIIKKVTKHMEKYEFNVVGQELYNFIWNDFCDWYLELAKIEMNNQTKTVLILVLKNILKMLHPFMPYVTEEIYLKLPQVKESIMISDYPKDKKEYLFPKEVTIINQIIEIITQIRIIKNEEKINTKIIIINNLKQEAKALIDNNTIIFEKLLKAEIENKINPKLIQKEIHFSFGKIIIGYKGEESLVSITELQKEHQRLLFSIKRRKKLLANEGYLKKAPQKIVIEEKQKLQKEETLLEILDNKIKKFK